MSQVQVRIEAMLAGFPQLAAMMGTQWAWPLVESAHFVGLTLLFGSIAAWDLRLMGLMREVPVAAFHRLVPVALVGFGVNVATGFCFLVAFPNQYVYNSAFHLKAACMLLAGLNVVLFYTTMFRQVRTLPAGVQPPLMARASGVLSLALWITVIVCGRMITFFRPAVCDAAGPAAFLADCIVR